MKKKLDFKGVIIKFDTHNDTYRIMINSEIGEWLEDMDPEYKYIQYISLSIYGIPKIYDEDTELALYDGDVDKFAKIGELNGHLIFMDDMEDECLDPVWVCDDFSGDLSYISSVIFDYYQENEDEFCSAPSVFYISELEIYKPYINNGFGSRVLQELPMLLKRNNHRIPDIIAYYPRPIKEVPEKKLTPYEVTLLRQSWGEFNDKLVAIPPKKETEEEIKEMIENEKNTPYYPEEYKNKKLFEFYKKNGFKEIHESRLLIKEI